MGGSGWRGGGLAYGLRCTCVMSGVGTMLGATPGPYQHLPPVPSAGCEGLVPALLDQ